jgi:hypothetical protein
MKMRSRRRLCWERATPWRSLWITDMSATKRGGYSVRAWRAPGHFSRPCPPESVPLKGVARPISFVRLMPSSYRPWAGVCAGRSKGARACRRLLCTGSVALLSMFSSLSQPVLAAGSRVSRTPVHGGEGRWTVWLTGHAGAWRPSMG